MDLYLDFETFSSVNLKTCGVYRYVASPDFEVMLTAYSIDGSPTKCFDNITTAHDDPLADNLPDELRAAILNPNCLIHAFNVQFERLCLKAMWGFDIPLERFRCTMVHALYCGLPGKLSDVGAALGFGEDKKKMYIGSALIRVFCVPHKATKKRPTTRTYPWDEPEKWADFIKYNIRDVDTEMEIERRLACVPVPPSIWAEWRLDQEINDRGARVDMSLIDGALRAADRVEHRLIAEAEKISGLDNPKSVTQLLKWLNTEIDENVEDLRKDTVKDLLASGVDSSKATRMLEIRQLVSKTSTKKYVTMKNTAGADDRVRGLFQFYGANRSGRFAGRLCQVQNLPRNYMEDLDGARRYAVLGDDEALELLYENVPDTLSQLIRTTFIPSEGNKLIVSDFSAIEARVIAWLAGETWVNEVFATHGKIYEATASQMFGVPLEKIKKGEPEYELRQRGKVAQLACIAENELVTTDVGLVPIQNVTTDMRVWDGEKFVSHEGVAFRGRKRVIFYDNLWATPDHYCKPMNCYFSGYVALGELKRRKEKLYLCATCARRSPLFKQRFAKTYDIRNAGDLHRYTVSGVLVHNCGYQGGPAAMERMDTGHKIDPDLYPELVERWRTANPHIVDLWYRIGDAAMKCVETGIPQEVECVRFSHVSAGEDGWMAVK